MVRMPSRLRHLYLEYWVEPRAKYVVSHPKSGRTWLAVMLGAVCAQLTGRPFTLSLYRYGGARTGLPYILFSHDGAGTARTLNRDKRAYRGKDVLLLVRDPRDVLVSHYFQLTKRRPVFSGDLDAFIHSPQYGIDWLMEYMNAWDTARTVPAHFMIVSYEECWRDPAGTLRGALEFFGIGGMTDAVLAAAVEMGTFDNMQRLEAAGALDDFRLRPADVSDPESFKVRRGRIGGHVEYLNQEQIRYLDERIRARLSPIFSAYIR